jgi:hypothetical protein
MLANFSVTRYSSPALASRSIWVWKSNDSKMSRTAGENACMYANRFSLMWSWSPISFFMSSGDVL